MTDPLTLLEGDVLERIREIPDDSVHCVVTSPPYWAVRDYGVVGQYGLEPTIQDYLARMVDVFREVRRVLRPDGTAWVNMGDCYRPDGVDELKPKDLVGQPWRLAFALRDDGWWLRSDIVWSKANPMPESATDRPTKSHEYVFLLAKRDRYFYDAEAIVEPASPNTNSRGNGTSPKAEAEAEAEASGRHVGFGAATAGRVLTRNARTVWDIPARPFPDAHFATFPEDLPRRCILAGTSMLGCCSICGAPRERIVEAVGGTTGQSWSDGEQGRELADGHQQSSETAAAWRNGEYSRRTVGWRNGCKCEAPSVPCTVFDPFAGSGTTGKVAIEMGRRAVLIELNPEYAKLIRKRCTTTIGMVL